MTRRLGSTGTALAVALPWIVAAASFLAATVAWIRPGGAPPPPHVGDDGSGRPRVLENALATAQAENAALRRELDRLLANRRDDAPAAATGAAGATGETAIGSSTPPTHTQEELEQLADDIRDGVSRAAAGDTAGAQGAALAMAKALRAGRAAFEPLRDAYLEATDPKARMMMIPSLIFTGSTDAREFILTEAQSETDPGLRAVLLKQAAGLTTPDMAPVMKDTFLDVLAGDESESTRVAAVRGLRYARGDDVQKALVAAASSESAEVRRVAIESLATRPLARRQLRQLLANERSPDIRELGECHLLIAEGR